MKEKILERMEEYGWQLDDFAAAYEYHYSTLDEWFNLICEDEKFNFKKIDIYDFVFFVEFMSDFLKALNEIDEEDKNV